NDGTISIEKHLKNVKLRGARPIVWATFAVPVENYYNMNLNIDDLCDRLGLRDFNKCDYVVKVLYNLNKIEKLRLPNIIDAGVNPAFFPSGEEDQIGYTHDLRNNLGGFPEIVHEPIAIKKIDSIGYLGHKTRNASSKIFEENRKGE
ncbi:MAG: hypothetical protein QG657_4061, partial [Acidobacteriota bacterium]|nr:hypothetical protein [Acidobacteriota bacterium]